MPREVREGTDSVLESNYSDIYYCRPISEDWPTDHSDLTALSPVKQILGPTQFQQPYYTTKVESTTIILT